MGVARLRRRAMGTFLEHAHAPEIVHMPNVRRRRGQHAGEEPSLRVVIQGEDQERQLTRFCTRSRWLHMISPSRPSEMARKVPKGSSE
jgi:hypothetical protein